MSEPYLVLVPVKRTDFAEGANTENVEIRNDLMRIHGRYRTLKGAVAGHILDMKAGSMIVKEIEWEATEK